MAKHIMKIFNGCVLEKSQQERKQIREYQTIYVHLKR